MIHAFQSSAAMKGAIELGLFTALGGESMTAATLARRISASERGVRILCDYLVVGELLEKRGDQYRSRPDSAMFLDENSPTYVGSVGRFMLDTEVFRSFSDIASVVRKGGTLMDGQGTVEPDNPLWVDFARSMVPLMMPSADFIGELATRNVSNGEPLKVLDIAAGHGVFGIGIATRHPQAEVVALDWSAVLDVASENAEKAGVANRHTRLVGNAFDVDFGTGYDIVLLTNFLHHYDIPTCTTLLRKVHGALSDGGRAITLDYIASKGRLSRWSSRRSRPPRPCDRLRAPVRSRGRPRRAPSPPHGRPTTHSTRRGGSVLASRSGAAWRARARRGDAWSWATST